MDVQDLAAAEVDENIFPTAADAVNRVAGGTFFDGSRELRTRYAGAENPDHGDFSVQCVAAEATADRFYFGKFRHS